MEERKEEKTNKPEYIDLLLPIGGSERARSFPVIAVSLTEKKEFWLPKVRPARYGEKVRIWHPYERRIIVVDTYRTGRGRKVIKILLNCTGLSDEEALREAAKISQELAYYLDITPVEEI